MAFSEVEYHKNGAS